MGKAFWMIFHDFYIFLKMSYPSVKFDEKLDGDVGEPIRLIVE